MYPFETYFLQITLRASILLGLAPILALLMRRSSAAARHLLWTLTLLACLLLPFLFLALPAWHVLPSWPAPSTIIPLTLAAPEPVALPPPAEITAPTVVPSIQASSIQPSPSSFDLRHSSFPAIIYLAGVTVVLLPLLFSPLLLRRLLSTASPAEPSLVTTYFRMAHDLHLSTVCIRLLTSPSCQVPLTVKFLRPVILLPAAATDWPAQTLRMVLRHELAHIKRKDSLTFFLARLTLALYWFHPLAWFAVRQLAAERERAADDLVLSLGEKPSEYASTLLSFIRTPVSIPALTLPMARPNTTESRLQAILAPLHRRLSRSGAIMLAGSLSLLALLTAIVACQDQSSAPLALPQAATSQTQFASLSSDASSPKRITLFAPGSNQPAGLNLVTSETRIIAQPVVLPLQKDILRTWKIDLVLNPPPAQSSSHPEQVIFVERHKRQVALLQQITADTIKAEAEANAANHVLKRIVQLKEAGKLELTSDVLQKVEEDPQIRTLRSKSLSLDQDRAAEMVSPGLTSVQRYARVGLFDARIETVKAQMASTKAELEIRFKLRAEEDAERRALNLESQARFFRDQRKRQEDEVLQLEKRLMEQQRAELRDVLPSLLAPDLRLVQLPQGDWSTLTPSQAADLLPRARTSNNPHRSSASETPTYLFQTPTGACGLLQILSATTSPPAITLQYKILSRPLPPG